MRLVRSLVAAGTPIVVIVAPAGYGKSTLLSEWAARDERGFARISFARARAAADTQRLIEAASRSRSPRVIAVDDAQLADPADVRALLEAAQHLPSGSTLALASRARPHELMGHLRAHRLVLELDAADLALTRLEAAMLVDAAGVRLDGAQLDRLLARTEGWAAALYLAALSVGQADDPDAAIAACNGGDRELADFLRDELLAELDPGERDFLRRSSVLRRLEPGAG